MKKNILIILGHPLEESLNTQFAQTYANSAKEAGSAVRVLNLEEMDFDPVLHVAYNGKQELEPCLIKAQEDIKWAQHIVFVFPSWWAAIPAKLKGFIDRVFLPGFAFSYEKGKTLHTMLLKGKTAELLITMDAPKWFYRFVYGNPIEKQLKRGVLKFCGFSKVKVRIFPSVRHADQKKRDSWKQKVYCIAKAA